jgi:hypothetical protein
MILHQVIKGLLMSNANNSGLLQVLQVLQVLHINSLIFD